MSDIITKSPPAMGTGELLENAFPPQETSPSNTQGGQKTQGGNSPPRLRLVVPIAKPEHDSRIEVVLSARGFGRAGLYRLTERRFHQLCAEARRLAGGTSV
jgi:hypothetical protein